MHNTLKYIGFVFSSACLLIASCSEQEQKSAEETHAVPTVEVISPVSAQPYYTAQLPGELKPYEEVRIHAKIKGFLKEVYVDRGSMVKKGQLLAILEAPEIMQQYLSAKSDEGKYQQEYIFAQQAYDRLKAAAQTVGAVAEIELDRAQSQLNSTKAALESAKANSGVPAQMNSYLKIIAPFDGVVTERKVSEGALVGDNSEELFSLAQTGTLRLTIAVPEKFSQSLHKGMKVKFTVNSLPGRSFEAELSRSSSVIQRNGRALFTEFDVSNNNGELSGGEYAQVQLQLQRSAKTTWVPENSIIRTQSGNFVLKVDGQKVKRIPVIEGGRLDNLQEVFGEIDMADKLIKNASEEFKEGSVVEVSTATQSSEDI
jgi:RND family efflux transporter MFP subunit